MAVPIASSLPWLPTGKGDSQLSFIELTVGEFDADVVDSPAFA
jgi:hypothetical protein